MAANRYIERYKKGLQQREEKRQSKMAWSKTNKFLTGAAAITAGAFAAHTLHPKGIIGALESVAKPTNAAFGAFKSTMDRYVSGSGHGVLKGVDTAINAVDVFNNPKGAVDHFRSTYKSIAKRTDDLHIDILRKQKTNVIDGIKKALKRDAISTQANKNLNKFIEDNEGDLAKIASDFQKKNQYRLSKLSSGDKKEVNYALAKLDSFNEANKEIRDSAQKMIFDSISGASEARPKNVDNIQADALKKMMDEIVENQQSQSSFIKKKFNNIFGYKNATVDDLLNYGDDFLDDESRKFLNTLKINHGADFKKFVVDDSLYMYKGKVVDSRNFKKLGRNIRSGFSGGILGHLTYQRDLMAMNDFSKRAGTLIRSGYNVPTLEGYGVLGKDGVLKESLISVGDNIYRLNDMSKPLAEGFHLASGRYGSTKRLVSSMSGVNAPDWSNERAYNWLLDVGGKRQPGLLTKFKSIFTKSKDPLYFKNEMNRLFTVTEDMAQKIQSGTALSVLPEIDYRMMKDLEQYMRHQSSGFGHEMLEKVLRDLDGTEISSKLKGLKFDTEDDLVESYIKVTKEHLGKQGAKMPDDTSLRARAYNILNTSTQRKNKRIFAGNKLNEGKDRLLRDISEKVTNLRGSDRTLEIAESMYKNKEISGAQFVEINKSVASFKISGSMDGSSFDGAEITKILAGKKDPYVRLAIEDSLKETHPAFGFGRVKEFQENFHGDVLPVKKFNPKILNDWKSVITGGRNDMSKVNKGTLLTYGMMHRLNDMVRHFDFMPLAMSDDSMGSPLSTFGNIMAKRVMPIYAGVTALKYTSDYWSEISGSGYTLEQHKERTKANATLRLSKFKDATGLTSAFKFFDRVTPGNEGIKASVNKLPFMGPLAPLTIGMEALNSVGTFSGRTEKEWVDYFNTGEDPVRKGRYWILGSTPWMGESIDHYEPNSYRQAMSQWEYTDTVYGSRENYWAHSWMPTPTEPLAPVKRFVTDRYWFEKMHLKDRPYPLTGEMFDPNTPWGTLLNPTIGRILKPQIKLSAGATDEDLERIEKNNAYAKDVIARFSGGDLQLSTYIPKYTMSTNVGVATGGGRIGSGNVMVNGVAGNKANSNAVGVQGGGPGGSGAAIRLTENPESSGLVVNGQNYSLKDLKNINQSIIDKSGKISRINKKNILNTGFTMSYYEPREEGELALDVQSPTDIGYSMERTLDIFKDITGARGFLASMVTGGDDYGEGQAVLATASDAYAASSRFWDTGLGGRGGELSEIFRRFINKRPGLYKVINDIPNTMPGWMPDRFRTGDPYTEVNRGEIRLPGEAYESMNKLHPDEYGRYGAVDRAAILADIAPYSQEYKLWSKIASEQNLSQEAKEFLAQAKEQKEEANKKYHMTPYKFLGQDIERESAIVEKFLDSSRFTVKGSDRIYRLAGVNTNFNAETEEGKNTLNILEQTMMPGSEITLLASKDSNPNASTPAVVYSQDSNVNRRLLDSGVQAKEEDGAIDTYVNLGVGGRALGRIWEGVAHAPIPIVHNKFFNVRSPMEHYKDYQVYGKEWQSWNEPVDDLLVPSFQSAWARNPFWATLSGATAGAITGLLLGGPGVRKAMSGFGAVAAGVGSIARSQYELETGKAWIPERREEERKIWEYYDLLKFVKNKRLYNKYVDVAKKEENVDVEKIISEMEEIDERLKKKEEMLEGFSKHLLRYGISKEDTVQKRINSEGRVEYNLVTEKEFIESKRKEILQELRDTKAEEVLVGLGPYARMAVKYRQEYRSTLFGLDGSSTFQQMFSAFPSKDREYLQHFSKVTDEKEREEILKIVPDNQKRAYKILWGMETEKESLIDMFGEYALPDENWFGWREGADLEDSMIKLIENNGYDPKDFGLWKDYTVEEELTPAPVEYGRRFDRKSSGFIRTRLEEVLTDYDIRDVDIKITPREDNSININFDMVQDVTGKIQLEIQRALGG
jgi:hypothetical protein